MILKNLCDYYDRKKSLGDLVDDAFEVRNIPFVIVINEKGQFVQLLETGLTKEEWKQGKKEVLYTLPKGYASRSGTQSYKKPNTLWDHTGFVLGDFNQESDPSKTEKNKEKAYKQHEHFKIKVNQIAKDTKDVQVCAVALFLNSDREKEKLFQSEDWQSVVKSKNKNVSFKVAGYPYLVPESENVQRWAKDNEASEDDLKGQCLITGEYTSIARLHPPIKGVDGTIASGAAIASFEADPLNSYGLENGENAPVSVQKAREYGIALNHLLRKNSPNKFVLNDMTMVCWSEKSSSLETIIPNQFLFAPKSKDDPDAGIEQIKSALSVIHSKGQSSDEGSQSFFVLGLKGANGRMAVQYWRKTTAFEIAESVRQWFDDVSLPSHKFGLFTPSLYQLIVGLLPKDLRNKDRLRKDDFKKIPPRLSSDIASAIFDNRPLPDTLLKLAMNRNKAERYVSGIRAAILKAYVNREARKNNQPYMEITMDFNMEGKPLGYRLGALLATYERIQYAAYNGKVNNSVRNKFFASMSTRPLVVLGQLSRMSENHMKVLKRESPGYQKYLSQVLETIVSGIDLETIPGHMGSKEQSYFALGYYQKREDFFKKKNSDTTKGETE